MKLLLLLMSSTLLIILSTFPRSDAAIKCAMKLYLCKRSYGCWHFKNLRKVHNCTECTVKTASLRQYPGLGFVLGHGCLSGQVVEMNCDAVMGDHEMHEEYKLTCSTCSNEDYCNTNTTNYPITPVYLEARGVVTLGTVLLALGIVIFTCTSIFKQYFRVNWRALFVALSILTFFVFFGLGLRMIIVGEY